MRRPGGRSPFIRRRTTLRSLDVNGAGYVFVVYPVFIEYMVCMCAHTHIRKRGFRDTLSYVYAQKFLLNRGVLITPFHNMMLVCQQTTADDVDRLVAQFDACLGELAG